MSKPAREAYSMKCAVKFGNYLLLPARHMDIIEQGFSQPMWALPGQYRPLSKPVMLGSGAYKPMQPYQTRFVTYEWLEKRAKLYGLPIETVEYPAWS